MSTESVSGEVKKEARRMTNLCKTIRTEIALFSMCAAHDVPFIIEAACDNWEEYLEAIESNEELENAGFADGLTDIQTILSEGISEQEKWESKWGIRSEENRYTREDYLRLESLMRTYSSRLTRTGGMDAQQEDTLMSCCKMRLEADIALSRGDKEGVDIAAKLNKMIQDNLSAENLRKKDEKPMDDVRIDNIVTLMKQKYGLSGSFSKEEVLDAVGKWMTSHHYPMTLDAANQMLLSIINTTRRNDDEAEFSELPPGAGIVDGLGEFAKKPNDMENEAYDYLGLSHQPNDRG